MKHNIGKHIVLDKTHRFYIDSEEDNKCAICRVNRKGKMTQDEVGKLLGLTKMRISQIEKQAIAKLRKRAYKKKLSNLSDFLD